MWSTIIIIYITIVHQMFNSSKFNKYVYVILNKNYTYKTSL